MAAMKIGELAQRTGLATSRIRFYERIGLLSVARRQANGYRSYPEEAVLALRLIATAQRAGFSLDELRQLLPDDLEHWQHDELLATLHSKLQSIDLMLAQLTKSRAELSELIAQIEARPEDMDCAGNARRVLSQMRLLGQGDEAGESGQPRS
jgi:DNA-binding transcriptional MerR regulator